MSRRIIKSQKLISSSEIAITPPISSEYVDRLRNLIPAETTTLYISGLAIIPTTEKYSLMIWALLCLILTFLFMAWQTSQNQTGRTFKINKPDWVHVTLSSISFIFWVYILGGPFTAFGWTISYVGGLAMLVYSFVIPAFYKGQPQG